MDGDNSLPPGTNKLRGRPRKYDGDAQARARAIREAHRKGRVRLEVELSPEEDARLEEMARVTVISKSQVIRELIARAAGNGPGVRNSAVLHQEDPEDPEGRD